MNRFISILLLILVCLSSCKKPDDRKAAGDAGTVPETADKAEQETPIGEDTAEVTHTGWDDYSEEKKALLCLSSRILRGKITGTEEAGNGMLRCTVQANPYTADDPGNDELIFIPASLSLDGEKEYLFFLRGSSTGYHLYNEEYSALPLLKEEVYGDPARFTVSIPELKVEKDTLMILADYAHRSPEKMKEDAALIVRGTITGNDGGVMTAPEEPDQNAEITTYTVEVAEVFKGDAEGTIKVKITNGRGYSPDIIRYGEDAHRRIELDRFQMKEGEVLLMLEQIDGEYCMTPPLDGYFIRGNNGGFIRGTAGGTELDLSILE